MAEQEIVTRHFCYVGPATEGLLQQVNDKDWCKALKSAPQFAAEVVNENPQLKFEYWGKGVGCSGTRHRITHDEPGPAHEALDRGSNGTLVVAAGLATSSLESLLSGEAAI